ncbi:MMPL family transporter [Corynebacterium uberis]|uniref:MMPL family transporter n=1 Tax=Corynebacterium TaxID=1716 RepID=UPI001D0AA3A9|nr:MMPL family transporter [Corynebacterium uberis]MCZ9308813.1 MMPL family transporter [Corynebacterium sp. c6VSa_13]UDL72659.1 MMPL family transporter [Corynebacterium uberis]UDL76465.1 MMPL family transporter [Corynebacterium uberis]UDL78677.1 MMPL family transporter [Corynebacterium uberis]UDL80956.1 MMPL family transporter [Corynebacterium uberis]
MSRFLYKLGSTAYRNKWPFLATWLIILIAVGGLAGAFAKQPATSFSIPGLPAMETQEKMLAHFPEAGDALQAPSGTVVFSGADGKKLDDPAVMAQVDATIDKLTATGALVEDPQAPLVNPVLAAQGMSQKLHQQLGAQGTPEEKIDADIAALSPLSPDHTTGTLTIAFNAETSMDIDHDARTRVTDILDEANNSSDLNVSYNGNAFSGRGEGLNLSSELLGLAVAAIVLLVTFGSFVAAGMPLFSAIIGVALGVLGVQLATIVSSDVNEMTPTLASMIGLAVGIDYALFILSRFRSELITLAGAHNDPPADVKRKIKELSVEQRAHAMGRAAGTAGSSVVFAGLTVLIALAALSIINIPFLTWMAGAAAVTVALAVMVALSFLPALLGLLGTKVFAGTVPGPKVPDPENATPTMGLRWVRLIRARPWAFLVAGVALLGLCAIPVGSMRLAMPTDGMEAPGTPQRAAYDQISESFGPGRNAPMIALVEADQVSEQSRMPVFAEAVSTFASTEGVDNAQIVGISEDHSAAQVMITPHDGATDEATQDTLARLRDAEADFSSQHDGAHYGITGVTPIFVDMSARLADVLVPYLAIVIALAFLVLMVVFRSIWVPLIAAAGFGLSVLATFGLTVAIFQEGWLGIISDPQPLLSFLPIMLIGLVFGLAMDYEVFLVTRMREGFHHGKTAGNATANGFKHGSRVVTAAALIMISVFAAFALQDMAFIKTMGFALAAAVFLDAFVVRMTIIPATMFLLDKHAWWLPHWLGKILPRVDVEGEALTDSAAAAPTTTQGEHDQPNQQ